MYKIASLLNCSKLTWCHIETADCALSQLLIVKYTVAIGCIFVWYNDRNVFDMSTSSDDPLYPRRGTCVYQHVHCEIVMN